jgi:hypothetical protein
LFYGWTRCSDLEIPSGGWPGCDEGNAQVWLSELAGPHVTFGILDIYVYGNTALRLGGDPRIGFSEICDGTLPDPLCRQVTDPEDFGSVGFGVPGYNPCEGAPVCDVSPSFLDFGTVEAGSSSDLGFTISNTGSTVVAGTVSELCDDYSIVSGGGAYSLSTGQTHAVTVRFEPATEGARGCTIETGDAACVDVSCSGVGVPPPPCTVTPEFLFFGGVQVGFHRDRTFNIVNSGDTTLVGAVSELCDHYSIISGAGPYTLLPAMLQEVTVRYEPTSEGQHLCVIETGDEACSDVQCIGDGYYDPGPSDTNGKWALHIAGPHNSQSNTCGFRVTDCDNDIDVTEDSPGGRFDIYVIGLDIHKVVGTRFGLTCDGPPPYFYGWTNCAELEIPTVGWPGCGEGTALTWGSPQYGPHVTVGILDAYVYAGSNLKLEMDIDPRVGFAEWCDGEEPSPNCWQTTSSYYFGAVGFGRSGYNPCDGGAVPVQLEGFEATSMESGILLEWNCAGLSGWDRFFLHRSVESPGGDYLIVNGEPIEPDEISGLYSHLDSDVIPGTLYYYKLELVQSGGGGVFFGPYSALAAAPTAHYALEQNVPNPFARGGRTAIHYSVARAGQVEIRIIDAAGRLIKTLTDQAGPGTNQITWDGTDDRGAAVSTGVYFYQFSCEGFTSQRKMLLVE